MERIQALINRLQEQWNQQANTAQMLATIQLLQVELSQSTSNSGKILGTSKVAVLMPASSQYKKQNMEKDLPSATYQKPNVNPISMESLNQVDIQFDPMTEIPTLSQQKGVKEVNELVSQSESLNDKLKEDKTELMQVLNESPIGDLRKGIGINDQFVFINELFRGDESLYERSIKTINNFKIYPEAEYWMNRELKPKLGWDENRESVRHFYQLIKRRFS